MTPNVIYALLICVGLSSAVYAQKVAHCETDFRFLLMEAHNSYCWIGQTQHGDCHSSQVIQLNFTGEKVHASMLASASFDEWAWAERLAKGISQDYAVNLDSDNNFAYPLAGLKIRPPAYNAGLYNEFMTEMYGLCGAEWNDVKTPRGLELPKITADKEASLVYYHPGGLYFNYEIEQAVYFPDSGYLLIFTQQKQKCGHGAVMNGFLIFKLG